MNKNEGKMSEKSFKDEQVLVDRKSYENPTLTDLGKMQRLTLAGKEGSLVDVDQNISSTMP